MDGTAIGPVAFPRGLAARPGTLGFAGYPGTDHQRVRKDDAHGGSCGVQALGEQEGGALQADGGSVLVPPGASPEAVHVVLSLKAAVGAVVWAWLPFAFHFSVGASPCHNHP
mgnify:CR=1 FL=1